MERNKWTFHGFTIHWKPIINNDMKTNVTVSYITIKGYEKTFDEKIIAFFETIGGVFQGSGTGFFGETPTRDLEFKIDMNKLKKK